MTDKESLDRQKILHLTSRYNMLGDRGLVAEMMDVFSSDAEFKALEKTMKGRKEIAAFLNANPTSPRHTVTRHHLSTQCIDIDGDHASGRSYFLVLTNIGPDHHGVYVDRYARLKGRWYITYRDVRLDWQAPNSVYDPLPVHNRKAVQPF